MGRVTIRVIVRRCRDAVQGGLFRCGTASRAAAAFQLGTGERAGVVAAGVGVWLLLLIYPNLSYPVLSCLLSLVFPLFLLFACALVGKRLSISAVSCAPCVSCVCVACVLCCVCLSSFHILFQSYLSPPYPAYHTAPTSTILPIPFLPLVPLRVFGVLQLDVPYERSCVCL